MAWQINKKIFLVSNASVMIHPVRCLRSYWIENHHKCSWSSFNALIPLSNQHIQLKHHEKFNRCRAHLVCKRREYNCSEREREKRIVSTFKLFTWNRFEYWKKHIKIKHVTRLRRPFVMVVDFCLCILIISFHETFNANKHFTSVKWIVCVCVYIVDVMNFFSVCNIVATGERVNTVLY